MSAPVRRSPAIDGRALLDAAGGGDAWAVGELCDRHGGALFGLARAVLGDPRRAEDVVVEVVVRTCTEPPASVGGNLRRELARLTYLSATRCLEDPDPARQQRAAVALVRCGEHTVGDVADLFGLPERDVAMLLSAGLRELEATDSKATGAPFG